MDTATVKVSNKFYKTALPADMIFTKDYVSHSISLDQARYATSIVAKYLDTATVKVSKKFYKTTLLADMIFKKEDVSTSEQILVRYTFKY